MEQSEQKNLLQIKTEIFRLVPKLRMARGRFHGKRLKFLKIF